MSKIPKWKEIDSSRYPKCYNAVQNEQNYPKKQSNSPKSSNNVQNPQNSPKIPKDTPNTLRLTHTSPEPTIPSP